MKHLCLLSLFIVQLSQTAAQPLTFDHITINEGLSNNTVYCITQDTDGFMWFGTRDGLSRFDGYDFRVYKSDTDESGSLASNNVQAIHTHKNGDIWLGFRRGGIAILKRTTQTFETLSVRIDSVQDISAVAIQSFFEDAQGDIWVGTAGLGVIQLSYTGQYKNQFASFLADTTRRLQDDHCFSFAEDAQGNIWFGTDGDAVHFYNRHSGAITVIRRSGLYSYRKALLTKGDSVFIGTEGNGLFIYDRRLQSFVAHHLPGRLIRDVHQFRKDEILISTDGNGVYTFNLRDGAIQNHQYSSSLNNSLNTNAIYDVYTDHDGNTWLGTFNGGINVLKVRGAPFYSYIPWSPGLQTPGAFSVLAFHEERDGKILVGLDGGGIWQLTPSVQDHRMTRYELPVSEDVIGNVITSLFRDSYGELWIGSFAHGLTRISADGKRFKRYVYDPSVSGGITNNNIWDITEDQSGIIWIAALGGGVLKYDRNEDRFVSFNPIPGDAESLSDWNARVVYVDGHNRVWIGTEDGGLNLYDREKKGFQSWLFNATDSTGLRSNTVFSIFEDSAGRLWIGTEGGGLLQFHIDENRFTQFSIRDGLQSNVINAIEEDNTGLIWVSTNHGISSLDPVTGVINNFDSHDGLVSDQFNQNASINCSSGELIFGNINGANGFNPALVKENPNPPKVVFTDFQLFNHSVSVEGYKGRKIISAALNDSPEIALWYQDNVFTISFAALEYTNPLKNRYAYRMLGFDEVWNNVDATRRKVTYTNLDPGEYTFEVRATNNNGCWSEEVRRLNLTIAPPFYATTWFRASVFLIGILVLIGVIKFRDAQRREKHNRELLVAEQKILQLKNLNLKEEVQQKNSELSAALLQSAHKNKALDGLKHELAELSVRPSFETEKRSELKGLIRKIEGEIQSVDYWERFQLNFNQIHQDFSEKIHARHPNLTQNDIRLCCLLKINLTNREIAAIQNISIAGVEKSKFRLKRKLSLDPEADLNAHILTFS